MTVTRLVIAAFRNAASRCPEVQQAWISVSFRVGALLPNSLLPASIQRIGDLDMLLRCMEDDFSLPSEGAGETDIFSTTYQVMLSELWVGAVYEIFRLLNERKLAPDDDAFRALAYDLKLLRIPLEKYEIAADRKLSEPLLMQRNSSKTVVNNIYQYSKSDKLRAHIMPSSISNRGSVMWHTIDINSESGNWIERRSLSERIITHWCRGVLGQTTASTR